MIRFMVLFIVTLVQAAFFSLAQAEDYSSYDDIIRELKGSTSAPLQLGEPNTSSLESVKIHAGVALVSSRVNLNLPQGAPSTKNMRGVEAAFGIDLFSPRWIAEGAVRSYNREKYSNTNMTLKEFDLKLVHKHMLDSKNFVRVGGGMAARYLDFDHSPVGSEPTSYTTPASVMLLGIGSQITPGISITAEANYRSAMISETADDSSVDGAIRLTGSF